MQYSDVVIRCGSCGYTASEWEFATNKPDDPLQCPECKDSANLLDSYCGRCQEMMTADDEKAEVVDKDGRHLIIHQNCYVSTDQIA